MAEGTPVDQLVYEQVKAFSIDFITTRKQALRKKKLVASGDLVESFQYTLVQEAQAGVLTMFLQFEDHGRYLDMKRVRHDRWGRDGIARLEAWVLAKGLNNFVPGYMKRHRRKTVPRNIANQIAWGIAVSKTGKFDRKRGWYARPRSGALNELYNQIAARIPDIVAGAIHKEFPL